MIYAIYKYGLRMEAIGFLDMYMFLHLQFSVSGFAIFGDSLYRVVSPFLKSAVLRVYDITIFANEYHNFCKSSYNF